MSDSQWSPRGRCRLAAGLLLVGLSLGAACSRSSDVVPVTNDPARQPAPAPKGPPLFEDVTAKTGIRFTYRNGEEADHYAIIESLGGGVALLDFDGDGLLDVLVAGGGEYSKTLAEYAEFANGEPVVRNDRFVPKSPAPEVRGRPCKLYRNLGNWKFQDVSREAGLEIPFCYSHGLAVTDYDRDGWPDVLVTGYNRLILLHNEPVPGRKGRHFVDVSQKAGLTERMWSSGAAWGDLDGDGFPDLFVSHYGDWGFDTNHPAKCVYDGKTRDVCQPRRFTPLPHTVYRNKGDGTFEEISSKLALRKYTPAKEPGKPAEDPGGKGMQVLMVDVDGDGRPDVYVANDTDDNFLYLNRSKPGQIILEEKGLYAGVARDERGTANGSMGVDAGDPYRTGRPSLLVTNYENELPALYQNVSADGRVMFNFATVTSGMGVVGANYVGWGVGFFDLDNDGWEDVVMVNGHAIRYPPAKYGRQQRPILFHNEHGRFRLITDEGGDYFLARHNARGVALGDLDNDGKIDMVISHLNEPVVVLRNVAQNANHWVGIRLEGDKHRDLVGARVELIGADGTQTRFVKGGGSFASSPDRRMVFGLGADSKPGKVRVHWPRGKVEEWDGLTSDSYWLLNEGKKEPEKLTGVR